MTYQPPLDDIRFALTHIAGLSDLEALPAFADLSQDLAAAVLEEAGKLSAGVLAPLYRVGDQQGSRLQNGVVRTPDGFREAYRAYVDGGWPSLPHPAAFGGQGLPRALATAVGEMVTSANMAFSLCPMLGQGAVESLLVYGSAEQQQTYLPKLVSGEWTGTMNLTEPQAGSDVGALRTRAEPVGDGSWRITGQKIFITWGDHDMAENVIHLVLARTPGAPAGTKGISLFLVPKFFVNADGSPGAANDLRVVSLEHKLGIHASPTCVMAYGDNGDCRGWLIGPEMGGMRAMFVMMNAARVGVGIQGLALAERAYQQAAKFSQERKQSTAIGDAPGASSPIVRHADVRRMLLTMRSQILAARGIAYVNAAALDRAHHAEDAAAKAQAQALADLLTPVTKAYLTDLGVEVSSLNLQVHGGMGYIEETGAAQIFRDARITPIYEGTNGIQALDLVMRKLPMQGGEYVRQYIKGIRDFAVSLPAPLADLGAPLLAGLDDLAAATDWLLETAGKDPRAAAAGATPYLRLFALVAGGYYLLKGLAAEGAADANRLTCARFFITQILPQTKGLLPAVTAGDAVLFEIADEAWAG